MPLEPRIRVSAVLRWQDRILLCKHEKVGRGDYWLLPGGGVNSGESLTDAPQRAFTAKHVVHIIFAGDLSGRSLEAATSKDAAVRGHRLFERAELDDVVLHPPIQRFLRRWESGDPAVYLGSLWAP